MSEEPIGERVARLEEQVRMIKDSQDRIETKVDRLLTAFNIGKGRAVAWAKAGGYTILVLGFLGWMYQNVLEPFMRK